MKKQQRTNEVNYYLSKMVVLNLQEKGILTFDESIKIIEDLGTQCNSLFAELERGNENENN